VNSRLRSVIDPELGDHMMIEHIWAIKGMLL
jgi:hypothetical protein